MDAGLAHHHDALLLGPRHAPRRLHGLAARTTNPLVLAAAVALAERDPVFPARAHPDLSLRVSLADIPALWRVQAGNHPCLDPGVPPGSALSLGPSGAVDHPRLARWLGAWNARDDDYH